MVKTLIVLYSLVMKCVSTLWTSSKINEVSRAVLNSLFFYEKISHALKAPKSTKSTYKHQKHKNATKQKHKTQISEQKSKIGLKNIWVEKSNLFAYLCFYVFCAHIEKKIENRKNEKSLQCNVLSTNVSTNHFSKCS